MGWNELSFRKRWVFIGSFFTVSMGLLGYHRGLVSAEGALLVICVCYFSIRIMGS
ncbi:hypothetical protein CHLRE_10g463650v5 [Chlamydomonas reinhardtii]|uniref:Uncharacterized protein n=1 Tax=Chlamydomonas reinhardtii TaxID=3055 RepID=A8I1F9_CHLRE|nr:uncharacterized protein CHLRE_10g463650v5 [Chlamydomonas reinhardtii]PNW78082.1 hypothetical protein CHLRE_10g463650v5 [Chlamydomonas reinhardtii]|eukprot:XP_001698613.1 predicted protein [Chlamydomonas reinhardtii]